MNPHIKIAIEITDQASKIPRRFFRSSVDIDYKQDKSPVTLADRETEEFIRNAIREQFPGHSIFGEEFDREINDSDYEWIIDPIDGTRYFVSGMPLYGMLLAKLKQGRPELGVIRMPELEEVYAGDGYEAICNNKFIRVSNTTNLDSAVVFVNEGEKLLDEFPSLLQRLCGAGRVNRLGYDCYPHMLLASGQVDLVFDYDLKPYDFLPLVPIIEGAGGLITDWNGKNLHLRSTGQVVSAATSELHRLALELIGQMVSVI